MPENETFLYYGRSASRWRPLAERMDGGHLPISIFPDIQDSFYRSCQRVWKQWKKHGIDPAQFFDAALNDPNSLPGLIKRAANDPNARLLRDAAAEVDSADREGLVRAFLKAAWESVANQLQLNRRNGANSPAFVEQIERMLTHIGDCLLKNPSRFPKRPSNGSRPPDLETQLGESLL